MKALKSITIIVAAIILAVLLMAAFPAGDQQPGASTNPGRSVVANDPNPYPPPVEPTAVPPDDDQEPKIVTPQPVEPDPTATPTKGMLIGIGPE